MDDEFKWNWYWEKSKNYGHEINDTLKGSDDSKDQTKETNNVEQLNDLYKFNCKYCLSKFAWECPFMRIHF